MGMRRALGVFRRGGLTDFPELVLRVALVLLLFLSSPLLAQNEPPMITNTSLDFSIAENSSAGATVGQVTASDPDPGSVLTYQIIGGTGMSLFEFTSTTSGTIVVSAAGAGMLNFEVLNAYTLMVAVIDNVSMSGSATFNISVTDVAEAAAFGTVPSDLEIAENLAGTSTPVPVGSPVTATGVGADTVAFSLGASAGDFTIEPGTGQIHYVGSGLDHETSPTVEFTVVATSSNASTSTMAMASQAVTVTVTDDNEAPMITNASFDFSIAENSSAGATVGEVTASDPDGDALTYEITGPDANLFAIASGPSGGTITVSAAGAGMLNFEARTMYVLTVTATDNGGLAADSATVNVSVTDVNEAPMITDTPFDFSIAEDSSEGATVGEVTASDPDDGDALTYEITGTGANLFAIASGPSGGTITVSAAGAGMLNFEATTAYVLTVTATDSGSLADSATVNVSVTDVPTTITLTGETTSLPEDTDTSSAIKVADIQVTDLDGRSLEIAGDDAALFALVGQTILQLRAGAPLSFEGSNARLDVLVRIAGTNIFDTLQIDVTDVDEPPTAPMLDNTVVVVNTDTSSGPVTIGQLSSVDPENDVISYELVGVTLDGSVVSGVFQIDGTSFQAAQNASFAIAGREYQVEIRALASGMAGLSATFAVRVGGAAFAPGDAIAENDAAPARFDLNFPGLTNGRIISASNTDISLLDGSTITVMVTRLDDNSIQVAGGPYDHEALSGGVLPLPMQIGSGTLDFTQTLNLPVTDLNEAPTITGFSLVVNDNGNMLLPDDPAAGFAVMDEDEDDSSTDFEFNLSDAPDQGNLERSDGEASPTWTPLAMGEVFMQSELAASHIRYAHGNNEMTSDAFSVTASDADGISSNEVVVSITITPQDEPPVITGTTEVYVAENTADGIFIDTGTSIELSPFGFTDPEGDGIDTDSGWMIASVTDSTGIYDVSDFEITEGGLLRIGREDGLNYEARAPDADTSISIFIQVNTRGAGTSTSMPAVSPLEVELRIVDVNEAPTARVQTPITGSDNEMFAFQVAEGGNHVLTAGNLLAEDEDLDDVAANLTFSQTVLPIHGKLQIKTGSTGTAADWTDLAPNDGFTQEQINGSEVRYLHDGGEMVSDTFSVQVTDDAGSRSSAVAIPVQIMPTDDEPRIVVENTLNLLEGGSVTINEGQLHFFAEDPDGAPNITFTFTLCNVPEGGDLKNEDTVLEKDDTFAEQDLNDGNISYEHGGADAGAGARNDGFGLLVGTTDAARDCTADSGEVVSVAITIGNVDDAPTALALTLVPELQPPMELSEGDTNDLSAANPLQVASIAATDPDGQGVNSDLELAGTDAAKFRLDDSTGSTSLLYLVDMVDYEQQNRLEVEVRPENNTAAAVSLTLNIRDADEHPAFVGDPYQVAIPEGAVGGDLVTEEISARDDDTLDLEYRAPIESLTYTIVPGDGSELFTIDPVTGVVRLAGGPTVEPFDYETGTREFTLMIQVTDSAFTDIAELTVAITNEDDTAPTLPAGQQFTAVPGSANGTAVGQISIQDPDSTQFVFEILGSEPADAPFQIDSAGRIRVRTERANGFLQPERSFYEGTASYQLRVTVTDSGENNSGIQQITIQLDTTTPAIFTRQVFFCELEDAAVGASPPDPASGEFPCTAGGTEEAMLSAGDGDGTVADLTWTVPGDTDFAFPIGTVYLQWQRGVQLNFENPPLRFDQNSKSGDVLVQACDVAGKCSRARLVVTILDVDEPPQILPAAPAPVTLSEGTSLPDQASARNIDLNEGTGRFQFEDPEGEPANVNWSLEVRMGEQDQLVNPAPFSIDNNGQLRESTQAIADFEGLPSETRYYKVTVNLRTRQQASGGFAFLEAIPRDVRINLTDVNERPVFSSTLYVLQVIGTADGDPVGAPLVASDPEEDTLSYSVLDTRVPFTIDASGQIRLTAADFDPGRNYSFAVRATDPDGEFDTADVQVRTDLTIPVITSPTVRFFENRPEPGADLSAQDQDTEAAALRWQVLGGDPYFALSGDPGDSRLRIRPDALLTVSCLDGSDARCFDFENEAFRNSLDFTSAVGERRRNIAVRVCDDSAPSKCSEAEIRVSVLDVNEPPILDSGQMLDVTEARVGNIQPALTFFDPEGQSSGSWTIREVNRGTSALIQLQEDWPFAGISPQGELIVRADRRLDYEELPDAERFYTLQVSVEVDNDTSALESVRVTVQDVNEPPEFGPGETFTRRIDDTIAGVRLQPIIAIFDPEGEQLELRVGDVSSPVFSPPLDGDSLPFVLAEAGGGVFLEVSDSPGRIPLGSADTYRFTIRGSSPGCDLTAFQSCSIEREFVIGFDTSIPIVESTQVVFLENNSEASQSLQARDGDDDVRDLFWSLVPGRGDELFSLGRERGAARLSIRSNVVSPLVISCDGTSAAKCFDYESLDFDGSSLGNQRSRVIVVEACDFALRCGRANIEVRVQDVDEAPVFPDAAPVFSVVENAPNQTLIGTPILAVDPDSPAERLAYSITATTPPGAPVQIDPDSGQLRIDRSAGSHDLDFETAPAYELTIQAIEAAGTAGTQRLQDEQTVRLQLIDVDDENPVILDQAFSIAAGAAEGDIVGTVRVVEDRDATGAAEFEFLAAPPSNELPFSIHPVTGEIRVALARTGLGAALPGSPRSYLMQVTVTDSGGNLSLAEITIRVGVNLPSIVDALVDFPENGGRAAADLSVRNFSGDLSTLTWSVTPADEWFTFASGRGNARLILRSGRALDFETVDLDALAPGRQTSRIIGVQVCAEPNQIAQDPRDLCGMSGVLVRVTDVDDPPAVAAASVVLRIRESEVSGFIFNHDFGISDQDGETLTYSIVDADPSDAPFTIIIDPMGRPRLQFTAGELDYENEQRRTYSLRVMATEAQTAVPLLQQRLSVAVPVTIEVEDIDDEPPRILADSRTFVVAPTTEADDEVARILFTDPDSPAGSAVIFTTVDESPAFQITEMGQDAGVIKARTGVSELPETLYVLRIRMTDSQGNTSDPVAIRLITNGDNPRITLSAVDFPENSGEVSTDLVAEDGNDANESLLWRVVPEDDYFTFPSGRGRARLIAKQPLNYENIDFDPEQPGMQRSRDIGVEVCDDTRPDPLCDAVTVTVTVTDRDDPPLISAVTVPDSSDPPLFIPIESPYEVQVRENILPGREIAKIEAEDDEGESLRYAITASQPANPPLRIDTDSGLLLADIAAGRVWDFESVPSYELRIQATEVVPPGQIALASFVDIVVRIVDVDDEPPQIADQAFAVPAGVADGWAVGTVAITDADELDSSTDFTFAMEATSSASLPFAIDARSGAISVRLASGVLAAAPVLYSLQVTATDGANNRSNPAAVEIRVRSGGTIAQRRSETSHLAQATANNMTGLLLDALRPRLTGRGGSSDGSPAQMVAALAVSLANSAATDWETEEALRKALSTLDWQTRLTPGKDAAAGDADAPGATVLWTRGGIRNVDGDPRLAHGLLAYEGTSWSVSTGVERTLRSNLSLGTSVSFVRSELDYKVSPDAGLQVQGNFQEIAYLANFYMTYRPLARSNIWTFLGVGGGEITDARRAGESREEGIADTSMMLAGLGLQYGSHFGLFDLDLGLSGYAVRKHVDSFVYQGAAPMETPSSDFDTFELRAGGRLGTGARFKPYIGLDMVQNLGDYHLDDKNALDAIVGLEWNGGRVRIALEANLEFLRDDRNLWGVRGGFRYLALPGGRGLSLGVTSDHGIRRNDRLGTDFLGTPIARDAPKDAIASPQVVLDGAYGLVSTTGAGLWTLHVQAKPGARRGYYQLGLRFQALSAGWQLGMEAHHSLAAGTPPDAGVALQFTHSFR